jgi:triacylglycerol lipase
MQPAPTNENISAEEFLDTARMLVGYSARAYDEHTFRDVATGTDVLVEYLPDYIVVAFRGTSEIKDWIIDADFWRVPVACGEVHAGFWRAWLGMKDKLRPLLRDPRPIYFTGHSLGGALAQISAKFFSNKGGRVAGVYTFGSPRLWNRAAADSYNAILRAATFNFVNACDPVPLMPGLLLGYRDAGQEVFLPDTGSWIVDPFIGTEIVADAMGAFRSWRAGSLALLPNHFIKRYDQKLEDLPS